MIDGLRLSFVAGTLTPGGAEKQLALQIDALAALRVPMQLVTLDGDGHYGATLRTLVDDYVSVSRRGGPLARLLRVAQVVRRFRPTIVQASHSYTNGHAWLAARRCGATAIGALRVDLATSLRANRGWNWLHFGAPDVIVSNSHVGADALRVSGRARAVAILDNAIAIASMEADQRPRPEAREALGLAPQDLAVVGVGTVRADKNFDRFLRVVRAAHATVPTLRGLVIGDGPELVRLRAAAADAGPDIVRFVGRRAPASQWLRAADIFLLTSDNEGVPNALMEAMATAVPCVVTEAGDAGRLVRAADGGITALPDDEAAIVAGLVALAGDAGRRAVLGRQARAYIETRHDVHGLGPMLLSLYGQWAPGGLHQG